MYIIKTWFAGHLLRRHEATDLKECEGYLAELEKQFKAGEVFLSSVGMTIIPITLAVDVICENELWCHDLKF